MLLAERALKLCSSVADTIVLACASPGEVKAERDLLTYVHTHMIHVHIFIGINIGKQLCIYKLYVYTGLYPHRHCVCAQDYAFTLCMYFFNSTAVYCLPVRVIFMCVSTLNWYQLLGRVGGSRFTFTPQAVKSFLL